MKSLAALDEFFLKKLILDALLNIFSSLRFLANQLNLMTKLKLMTNKFRAIKQIHLINFLKLVINLEIHTLIRNNY